MSVIVIIYRQGISIPVFTRTGCPRKTRKHPPPIPLWRGTGGGSFLFACFVGNIINLILQSDSYKILRCCNALILNTSKYMCRSKDMYPNHRTVFFMFAALFQKHLFNVLSFILSVSIFLSFQIASAVSMHSNVYQTSSKKYSAKKWIKNGQSKYKRAKFERAVIAYNKAIASYPNYFEAWDGLGNALYCLRSYDMAIQAYDKALSINPNHNATWVNKGIDR